MKLDFAFLEEAFVKLLGRIPLTLELTLVSFLIGTLLGAGIAVARRNKVRVLSQFLDFYVSFIRGTPLLLQIYLIYYAIPEILDAALSGAHPGYRTADHISSVALVIIALALNMSAYLSETIRSGLNAVNRGEIEAAEALGMKPWMISFRVTIPETVRICIPNFATQLINGLHGSSLAFYVTILEIMGTAQILAQDNWKYMETYLAAGAIYWMLTIIIEILSHLLERSANRHVSIIK